MTPAKPLASVSLDVDNLWSYMKTHGDAGWEGRPSYLHAFIPSVLEVLDQLGLRITFFIVGVDADREENAEVFPTLTRCGHEVGNHSYQHEPWLHLYSQEQLEEEIGKAERAIQRATGQRPLGFRGPSYNWSPELLRLLSDRGYLYDASTLPTYIGPLARAYYFSISRLRRDEKVERGILFGSLRDGLRPLRPYLWQLEGERRLLEMPVTTFPVVKTPFHLSYLHYLCRFSEGLALAYLRAAITACRLTGVEPSFLLHPLDLMGGDEVPQLAFFPGMELPSQRKRAFLVKVLRRLGEAFTLVDMSTHARSLLARDTLSVREAVPLRSASAMARGPYR
ncbi:MAG: polysaccharide deacetylase family protein [Gammaproteobacteria bacterium]